MITLLDCNVEICSAQTDRSGLSTMQKIYYMARGQPVDLVEGADGVFSIRRSRGWKHVDVSGYGHLEDCLSYYAQMAFRNHGMNRTMWIDDHAS